MWMCRIPSDRCMERLRVKGLFRPLLIHRICIEISLGFGSYRKISYTHTSDS
jgi:hypothetical protein